MRIPLAAVLLAALACVSVSARANEDPDAPVNAVRSSLQALKAEDAAPEKTRAALAALAAAAARVKPANPAAAAALERLKSAIKAADPADAKKLSEALKQIGARGDEFLAALAGGPGTALPGRRLDPQAEKRLAATMPEDVGRRAGRVMSGGFETTAGPGTVSAVGPTLVSPGASGGVPYLPVTAARGASDLGISVPGPNASVVQTPSGFKIFAAAFDANSYAPGAAAALENMRGYVMMKPPGMLPLDGVAQTSQFAAENFLMHFDVPAYVTSPRGRNEPLTLATPGSVKTVGFQAPLPVASNVTASANFSGTTIEPKVGGIMPSHGKAIHSVEGGGTVALNGVAVTGAASFSTVGNATYKGEVAGLAQGLKLTASYRAPGGVGNQSREMTAGFVQDLGDGQTLRGDLSVMDKTPGDLKGKDNFYSARLGYFKALAVVP